jgi:lysophospholipase L1-like esterase
MKSSRVLASGAIVVVAVIAACSDGRTLATAPANRPSVAGSAGVTGSPDRPVGVIAVGHSGMTGYGSDPSSPGTDTLANSWATGTNPAVHSIYLRMVKARPETAGHVINAARDGAKADQLPAMAAEALTRVPHPALALVQILGNDLRCDGTDQAHYAEFEVSVRQAVEAIVEASPETRVLLIGEPLPPASYAAALAALPSTPPSFIGTGPCYLFSANRTINQAAVVHVTNLLHGYELQLAKACVGIRQCHTDGGGAAKRKVQLDELGVDLQHPSVVGSARLASAEWPVIAAILAAH